MGRAVSPDKIKDDVIRARISSEVIKRLDAIAATTPEMERSDHLRIALREYIEREEARLGTKPSRTPRGRSTRSTEATSDEKSHLG